MPISFITLFALGFSSPAYAELRLPSHPLLAGRPSNLGYPRDGTRRGGGSRGELCELLPEMSPLTALMPDTATWTGEETEEEVVFSLTEQSSPDIWVYVPYSLENPSQLRFTLKDADDNQLIRVQLDPQSPLPATPGIINISLGELGINLLPEADYHWYVTVNCGEGPPITVDGWLRHRVNRSEDDPSYGFFVDALSTQQAEDSPTAAWQELLEAVGLSDISTAPIIDCCRFVEPSQN
ncbi:MAG: DUF928 domain-containing protein [Cyanobacteria bacterium P01_D01_bin.56]